MDTKNSPEIQELLDRGIEPDQPPTLLIFVALSVLTMIVVLSVILIFSLNITTIASEREKTTKVDKRLANLLSANLLDRDQVGYQDGAYCPLNKVQTDQLLKAEKDARIKGTFNVFDENKVIKNRSVCGFRMPLTETMNLAKKDWAKLKGSKASLLSPWNGTPARIHSGSSPKSK